MRWIMLAVSLLGFAISFGTQSVGVLVLGLLLALGGMVGAVFAFAAARVESVAQGQSSRELSILLDAKKGAVVAGTRPRPVSAAQAAKAPKQPPPQRAERGVEIDFSSVATAGAKSRGRGDHDQDRAEPAGDGDAGGGGD